MAKAVAAAKAGNCRYAFRLTLICQCHNTDATNKIQASGEKAVYDFLRTK